jgi:hypothetical protein
MVGAVLEVNHGMTGSTSGYKGKLMNLKVSSLDNYGKGCYPWRQTQEDKYLLRWRKCDKLDLGCLVG